MEETGAGKYLKNDALMLSLAVKIEVFYLKSKSITPLRLLLSLEFSQGKD